MSRMHSKSKGKSGSSKPVEKKQVAWLGVSQDEVNKLVQKFGKEDKAPSQIGMILRDSYGVPDIKIVTGKSITKILRESKLEKDIPEDMMALIKKSVALRDHLELNHKDVPAKRGLQLTESKIRRLAKHHIKTKKLPANWKFDPKTAKMLAD